MCRNALPAITPSFTLPGVHRMLAWLPSACNALGEHAGFIGRVQDHRAGAVAEQHAGGAVVEIENARKRFRADHQRRAMRAACG